MAKPDIGGGPPSVSGEDEGFGREIEVIRSLSEEPMELVDAPADLWDRIAASADDAADRPEAEAPVADVTELRSRRQWRTVVVGAAAVVVAVAVAAGIAVAVRSDDSPTELAAAELTPFDGAQVGDAGGRVELIDEDGSTRLRVDMHDLPAPAPGTFYELWLLDPSTGEPISIATMKDGSSDVATDVDVPSGTDTERFDVVDISVQEESAGPEHSGNSVLRGTLST